MVEFREFLIRLFQHLSTGDFTVIVECSGGEEFKADVIGYSEEYMEVHVRFHSDNLQKPGVREVKIGGFGYESEETVSLEACMVPVKDEHVFWTNIKLNK
ncbi:MAG: hypothetical protein WAZ19_02430 [Anaerolineae bacterium]